MMPPPPGRLGNICIWLVTVVLFLSILAGGALLVLFITLPETEETITFPAVGMILVGVPWLFWIMTCFYRSMAWRRQAAGAERSPSRVVPTFAASSSAAENNGAVSSDSPIGSPGSMRKVHFGVAAVVSEQDADGSGAGADGKLQDREADGGSCRTASGDDSSSLGSNESEMPLALSMS